METPTTGHAEPAAGPTAEDLAQLLRAAATGSDPAWRSIIALYARRVYALAISRCRRHDLAEEVTQSVFVTVASKLGSAAAGRYTEMGRFEPWLFRVAMNRIRDEMRRIKRHAEPTDPASLRFTGRDTDDASPHGTPSASHASPDSAAEELSALRLALVELSEADREVVELRHHAGLSFKQIAELLEEPLGTLLARHHRALRKLKDLLRSRGISDDSEDPS